ncbi:MAG: hypothetical protein V1789_07405 [PVC group bacterium]
MMVDEATGQPTGGNAPEITKAIPGEKAGSPGSTPSPDTAPAAENSHGSEHPRRKALFGFIPRGRAGRSRLIMPVVIGLLAVGLIALFAHARSQSRKLAEERGTLKLIEEQLAGLEQNLADKIRELNDTANDLKETAAVREQLKGQVTTLQADQNDLKKQIETTHSYTRTLENRLKAEQETISELQAAVREDRETEKRLFGKIESLLEDKKSLQDRLFQIQEQAGSSGAVEMPGLVVKNSRAAISSLQGVILKVNPEYAFVVLNRGESDGAKTGDRFRVMDRDREIGQVVATRILPDMTVADIDARKTHRNLRKGFAVFLNE